MRRHGTQNQEPDEPDELGEPQNQRTREPENPGTREPSHAAASLPRRARRSASAPNIPGSSLIVAGRMKTSARNATAIVSPSSPPKHAVGLYSENSRTPKPRLLIAAVVSDARPS